jgi:prepilin-type N-terminal cleavage/methylation domain-containing protein
MKKEEIMRLKIQNSKSSIFNFQSSMVMGFTLMELLVVIAIMGLLAGVLTPSLMNARERGRRTVCVGNLKVIGEAFHMFNIDLGEMPPTENDPVYEATNKIGDGGATITPIGMGYFYYDEYVEDFTVFVCPSSDYLRDSQTLKSNWTANNDTESSYIYRAKSGDSTLTLSDAKPAIVMDYNNTTGLYNHKGEYVNILFRNGNVKGVENKVHRADETTSKDGQLTLGGSGEETDPVTKDSLFRDMDGTTLEGGADYYQ